MTSFGFFMTDGTHWLNQTKTLPEGSPFIIHACDSSLHQIALNQSCGLNAVCNIDETMSIISRDSSTGVGTSIVHVFLFNLKGWILLEN